MYRNRCDACLLGLRNGCISHKQGMKRLQRYLESLRDVFKAGAERLLKTVDRGISTPLDGLIWCFSRPIISPKFCNEIRRYRNSVYVTRKDYIYHPPCDNPCPTSVRTWFNGELKESEYPD